MADIHPEARRRTIDKISDQADPLEPTRAGYADFLSRVAHDLRSPLGIVMHVIQRMETDFADALSDEQRSLVRLGNRGVRRLRDFVERVTLLAVLEAEELEPNLQTVDLAELGRRAVTAKVENEPRAGVSVTFEEAAGPCLACADPALVSAIVGELLQNAVAHARKTVRVGAVSDGSSAALFVEDDGAGVSAAASPTLFARFVARDARGGLGIGLSMARDLARALSGDLQLEQSRLPPGRPDTIGARLVLVLPRPA